MSAQADEVMIPARSEAIQVWGSCISRDMWPAADNRLTLAGYIARQSAVSAEHAIAVPEFEHGLESPFQGKQVIGDLGADALARITEANPDVVLLDIVDERLGLIEVDGGYVTRSSELRHSNWHRPFLKRGRIINFGTDEHFNLWSRSFASMLFRIREENPDAHFILNLMPFAKLDKYGATAPESMKMSSDEWNADFERYYAFAKQLPIDVVELPQYLAISDPDHQWGPAPFHYVPEAYEAVIAQIENLLEEKSTHDA